VHVLEPIETTGMTMRDVSVLRDRVRQCIAAELEVMKAA
jgi:hypothetical protein